MDRHPLATAGGFHRGLRRERNAPGQSDQLSGFSGGLRQRFGPADGSGDQVRVVQAGKTTLVRRVLDDLPYRCLAINADELRYTDVLSSRDLRRLRGLVEGYELLFIDEAQRIPEIGLNLKLLVDHLPHLRIVVTGSSSFRLNAVASKVQEPLTGRAWVHSSTPLQ